jgi:hypothetical protein
MILRIEGCATCPFAGKHTQTGAYCCNAMVYLVPEPGTDGWQRPFDGGRMPIPPPKWCPARREDITLVVTRRARDR